MSNPGLNINECVKEVRYQDLDSKCSTLHECGHYKGTVFPKWSAIYRHDVES